jgi:hypothetical protein
LVLSAHLAEGKQADLAEGKQADLAEGKQADLAEGKQADLAEGKQADLAEGKQAGLAHGEPDCGRAKPNFHGIPRWASAGSSGASAPTDFEMLPPCHARRLLRLSRRSSLGLTEAAQPEKQVGALKSEPHDGIRFD